MLTVTPIKAFTDNYIWVIQQPENPSVWMVDPGQADPVIQSLSNNKQTLAGILITHHHADHTGGIIPLLQWAGDIPVFAPANENIKGVTQPLMGGENLTLPETNIQMKVIAVPGHTLGHIAYLLDNKLFCGDTLFSGGCGRLFEGTAEQMYHSLSTLKQLDDNTQIYCAHEYTLKNLEFALAADPKNQQLADYIHWCQQQRQISSPTLPSSIGREKQINPFLRSEQANIRTQIEQYANASIMNNVEAFSLLRQWKDKF